MFFFYMNSSWGFALWRRFSPFLNLKITLSGKKRISAKKNNKKLSEIWKLLAEEFHPNHVYFYSYKYKKIKFFPTGAPLVITCRIGCEWVSVYFSPFYEFIIPRRETEAGAINLTLHCNRNCFKIIPLCLWQTK